MLVIASCIAACGASYHGLLMYVPDLLQETSTKFYNLHQPVQNWFWKFPNCKWNYFSHFLPSNPKLFLQNVYNFNQQVHSQSTNLLYKISDRDRHFFRDPSSSISDRSQIDQTGTTTTLLCLAVIMYSHRSKIRENMLT